MAMVHISLRKIYIYFIKKIKKYIYISDKKQIGHIRIINLFANLYIYASVYVFTY